MLDPCAGDERLYGVTDRAVTVTHFGPIRETIESTVDATEKRNNSLVNRIPIHVTPINRL